jgi:hypothetical protein
VRAKAVLGGLHHDCSPRGRDRVLQHTPALKSLPFARIASALVVGVLLQACGSLPRLDAVPSTLTERAVIPGIPNSRYWLDHDLAPFIQAVIQDDKREREGRSG